MPLRFEPLLTSHLDALATVLLDPAVYQHIEDELPTPDEFRLGLERALAAPGVHYLVRDAAGGMLGRLEATVHHQVAEVAFLFGAQHWGRGYATAGLSWFHDELVRNHAVPEFWATTTSANHRSQALLRRCGYSETGVPGFPLYSYAPGDLVFTRQSPV